MSMDDPKDVDPNPSPTDEEILKHVFVTVAKRPRLLTALKAAGVIMMAEFFSLSVLQCNFLYYPEKTKPQLVPVDAAVNRIIRAYNHYCLMLKDDIDPSDWINFTRQQYDQFRFYDEKHYNNLVVAALPAPPPPPAPAPIPTGMTAVAVATRPALSLVEQFQKGIKRDQNLFPELKNKELNDTWHRSFETQAHAQDVADVLDLSYLPSTQDLVDLFTEKQKYVYAVLKAKVLTDCGKAIVRTHSSTRDAQKVYAELKQHHTQSTKALMDLSDILTYITLAKLGSGDWQGSTETFITHWQNQLCLYKRLCEPGECFSDGQKKTMLQNAVHSINQLAAVKHNVELEHTKTGVALSYDQYCTFLVSAAGTYDCTHSGRRPDRRSVFFHNMDDPYDNDPPFDDYTNNTPVSLIAFNAAQQHLRRSFTGSRPPTGSCPLTGRPNWVMMVKTRWAALSQEGHSTWDKLSDKDKAVILGYSDDKFPIHQCPPAQRPPSQCVNLHKMSVYDYIQAHLHELLDKVYDVEDVPTDTTTDLTTDSQDILDDTQLSDNVLVKALATGKKLSPGNIRRLLSSSLAKKKSANKVKFQANSHIIYCADVHASSLAKHSLTDWGANGGVAGADVRVIHHTNRRVDIQGIDNHMINDVYIGMAGGVVMTIKGPVILVLHQYALLSKGRTIHAPGQLEWYGNDINDKSCKVKGGLQRILTQNGYVIPIVFDCGLPRVRIHPFTKDEWDKLPHIVMTDELDCRVDS